MGFCTASFINGANWPRPQNPRRGAFVPLSSSQVPELETSAMHCC
jgi:hypothetical protein